MPATPTVDETKNYATNVTVNWAPFVPPSGTVQSYTVYTTAANGDVTSQSVGLATVATIVGLSPGATYAITVTATVGGVATGPSDPLMHVSGAAQPQPPTGLRFTELQPSAVTLAWERPNDNGAEIVSYTVDCTALAYPGFDADPPGSLNGQLTKQVLVLGQDGAEPVNATVVTGLASASNYECTVSASNVPGISDPSAALAFATCVSEPPMMNTPYFISATTTTITVGWEALAWTNGKPVSKYRLKAFAQPDIFDVFPDYPWNGNPPQKTKNNIVTLSYEWVLGGLEPGFPFSFRIAAYNGADLAEDDSCLNPPTKARDGYGDYSLYVNDLYTLPTPPLAPLPVELDEPAQGKQLRLKWFAPYAMGANITNYTIYSNTTIPIRVFPADGQLTAYFSSLTPDTSYGFYITANNSEGESPRSPLAAFKTDLYVPDAVSEFVDPPVPPLASLPTAACYP